MYLVLKVCFEKSLASQPTTSKLDTETTANH